MKSFCLAAFIVLLAPLVHSATIVWTNTAGGDWFTAANWSPNVVPTAPNSASITIAGTYTVTISSGAVIVSGLTLGGPSGTQTLIEASPTALSITNSGTVTGTGILTINNGGLLGALTVQSGGQLILATATTKDVHTLVLVNQGTVIWSGGQLNAGGTPATTVNNTGLWQMTGDNNLGAAFGGPQMTWTNSGTVLKTAGTGITQISDFSFVNLPGGVIQANSGTLQFSGNVGSSVLGGSLVAAASSFINLSSGIWTDSAGNTSGAGTIQFAGGTLNLRTNIISGLKLTGGSVFVTGPTFQQAGAITNLTLDGATLRGTNVVGSGTLTVNSGGLMDQLTVNSGGLLVLTTSTIKNVNSFTLINQGAVHWSGGQLRAGGTPTTSIINSGLWQMSSDDTISLAFGGPQMTWTNSGVVGKSAGSGISHIGDFSFINLPSGLVQANSGTLQFDGNASSSILGGSFGAAASSFVNLSSGTWTDSGGGASGAGTVQFTGGTLNLRTNIISGLKLTGGTVFVTGPTFQQAGAITSLTLDGSTLRGTNAIGSGTLTVNSGGLMDQLTVLAGGQLLLGTSTLKNVNSLTLINQGTVLWSGGQLRAGGTPTTSIINSGLWQMTTDDTISLAFGGPQMTWTNSGTVLKSAAVGISHIGDFSFINLPTGQVQANSGTMQFDGNAGGGTLGGSLSAAASSFVNLSTGTWTDSGGTASGAGTVQFAGGTLNLRTNIISGLKLTGGSVFVITPTFQQAGAITNLTLDGATLHGANVIGSGKLTFNSGGIADALTVQPSGQLLLSSSSVKNVNSLTLVNQGTVLWSGGQLRTGGTPQTIISNGGSWQMTSDDQIGLAFGGPQNTWTNSGTVIKTAGTGISQINDFSFVNLPTGVIQANSGTVQFNGNAGSSVLGGSLAASSSGLVSINNGAWTDSGGSTSGAGTNRFNGGTLTLRTNIISGLKLTGGNVFVIAPTFQQAGAITNLTLDGATLNGTNVIGSGKLTVNSGGMVNQLSVQPGGQLLLTTTGIKNVNSLTLLNQGTVAWSGGQLRTGGNPTTTISNGGLWQMTSNDQMGSAFGGPQTTWTNSGTVTKTAGTGVSQINDFSFVNQPSGLVEVDSGTIQLPNLFTNTLGELRLNGGTLQANGALTVGGGIVDGAGNFGANLFTGGSLSPGQGTPGSIGFPAGLNLASGTTLAMSGTGTIPAVQYDQLSVTGAVVLGSSTLQIASLPTVAPGTTFVLIQNDGVDAVSGTFSGLAENGLIMVSGQAFRIHYAGGTGNDVTLVRDSGTGTPAPQLSGSKFSSGTFQFQGVGGNGAIYTVQATTNFLQWTNVGFATGSVSGNFNFTDTNAALFRLRFYRTTN